MNERTTNEQYFSKETAERLPNESWRRKALCLEISKKEEVLRELQAKFDAYLNSDEEMTDEVITYYAELMNEMDDVESSIYHYKQTIARLDAGETIADIYRSVFGC